MEIISQPKQEFYVMLKLTELEAKALHDLVSYGVQPFMDMYNERVGKSYAEKHQAGALMLFETAKKELPKHFSKFDEARKVFEKR